MLRTGSWISVAVLVAACFAAVGLPAADEPAAAADEPAAPADDAASAAPPYSVECEEQAGERVCFVDRDTYVGWRTYHAFCHVCHAQDAVGSTFAPNLLERMREIDKERFNYVLDNGFTGQVGVMPAWKENPNVTKQYGTLYSYLRARADGALPPGRPQRKLE